MADAPGTESRSGEANEPIETSALDRAALVLDR